MIGFAKYQSCCNDVAKLLKDCGVSANRTLHPNYPADLPNIMRSLNYRDRWQRCIDNLWYDYSFEDGALLQFRHSERSMSFSFIECPFEYPTFEDFAYERMGEDWEHFVEELQSEYELMRSSEVSEHSVTPLRYDYEPDLYREGLHPAGHLHFGVDCEIRLAVRKVLNPISFVMFVVRQHYPLRWEEFLRREDAEMRAREVRANLDDVPEALFKKRDLYEMFCA